MTTRHVVREGDATSLPWNERPVSMLAVDQLLVLMGFDNETARALYTAGSGSIQQMSSLTSAQLQALPNSGRKTATQLQALFEFARRSRMAEHAERTPLRGPNDIVAIMAPQMESLPVEQFHILCLDAQHRLIENVMITRGVLNSAEVHPREVFAEAIARRAASIVCVHNHPSGDPTPSNADRAITTQLAAAGRLMDIPMHDHIIIGRGRYMSFTEAGLL